MTRLLRAELLRLLARRMVWLTVVGAVVVSFFVLWGAQDQAKYLTPTSQAQRMSDFRTAQQEWKDNHVSWEKQCIDGLPPDLRDDVSARGGCAQPEPRAEDFLGEQNGLKGLYDTVSSVLMPIIFFAGFLMVASFIAAEFSTSAITNWLTFQPRRELVYASKLVVGIAGAAALAALMVVIVGVGTWFIGKNASLTADVTSATRSEILATMARLIPIGMVAGTLGAALAFILRHTAACLGVLVGYAIVVEGMMRNFIPGMTSWLGSINASAFVKHGTTYQTFSCSEVTGVCTEKLHHVSFAHGTLFLLGVSAIAIVAAGLAFRRRDVT